MAVATSAAFELQVLPEASEALLGELPTLQDEDRAYARRGLLTTGAVRLITDGNDASRLDRYRNKSDFEGGGRAGEFHETTEGDELWTAYQMYRRLRDFEPGAAEVYRTRAENLANYYKNIWPDDAWRASQSDPCNLDHVYGWGLRDWAVGEGDAQARAVVEAIARDVRQFLIDSNWYRGYQSALGRAQRRWARLLRLAVAAAEVSADPTVIEFRDQVVESVFSSEQWDPTAGMYFWDGGKTDREFGVNAFAAGWRACSSFHIGVLADSLWQLYRSLRGGRAIRGVTAEDVRSRIIAMANWVVRHGRDASLTSDNPNSPNPQTGASMGSNGTMTQHRSASRSTYNISLVNLLVFAYKLDGNPTYLDRAWDHFLDTQHNYFGGQRTERSSIEHYVDSRLASALGFAYLRVNKGELQYAYALFENGGSPRVLA
ncbi:MAG: hypothetical protein AAGF12_00280 [Myxococcota bacterium]